MQFSRNFSISQHLWTSHHWLECFVIFRKYKNLLENLGNLDQILNDLNCSEITRSEELNATTKEWRKITRDWNDKKNLIEENGKKASENNTNEIKR